MNQQQRAVVRQALEAFKGLYAIVEIAQEDIDCRFAWAEMPDAKEAITALRQLLEQPEQEHEHALERALTRLQKRYSELEAKVAAQPAVPTQCWKCGDMDAMGHAKCDVPACGMREKNTALDKMAGNACELGLNYDNKAVRDA